MDIGTFLRAAMSGGSAYMEGRENRRRSEEKARSEEEERARREKADARAALEHKLRVQQAQKEMAEPPMPPKYRFSGSGVSGETEDLMEAIRLGRELNPEKPEQPGEIRTSVGGVSRSFPDTEPGRAEAIQWRNETARATGSAGSFSRPDERSQDVRKFEQAAAKYTRGDRLEMRDRLSEFAPGHTAAAGTGSPLDRPDLDEADQAGLTMLYRQNEVRRQVIEEGFSDPMQIEAEVRRRLTSGS